MSEQEADAPTAAEEPTQPALAEPEQTADVEQADVPPPSDPPPPPAEVSPEGDTAKETAVTEDATAEEATVVETADAAPPISTEAPAPKESDAAEIPEAAETEKAEPPDTAESIPAEAQGDAVERKAEGEPEASPAQEAPPTETASPAPAEEKEARPLSNADFTKGESPEEMPVVIQPMSREETPPLMAEGDMPVAGGTPEKAASAVEEEELLLIEAEPLPEYNREELMQKYQVAIQEREVLSQQNRALQHKLSEYFRKKKIEETRQEVDKNATDQEQRYMKYMSNLEDLRQQQTLELEAYNEQLEEMKEKKAEKQGKVEEEWAKAAEFKRAVALAAINSRSGRPILPKDVDMYAANETKKEAEVSQVRLENIKLKNRLKKQEMQLKQKEELAEGLHLIDFEQLKIENQTYNEKIEERNEELLKLRKKITSTVQVLTHLKEKLQFVQAENYVRKDQLADVEQDVAQKRDILSRTKQARDALRHENNKFQQKCGLLGNTDLLRDFEVSTDEVDDLEHRLDMLKRTHAELTLSLNGVKRKIELAKENQS